MVEGTDTDYMKAVTGKILIAYHVLDDLANGVGVIRA
jgi:hypothetical protein